MWGGEETSLGGEFVGGEIPSMLSPSGREGGGGETRTFVGHLTFQKNFWSKSPPWGPKIWSNLMKYPPSQWIKIFIRLHFQLEEKLSISCSVICVCKFEISTSPLWQVSYYLNQADFRGKERLLAATFDHVMLVDRQSFTVNLVNSFSHTSHTWKF